ncbi:MAG: hypothetical protein ACYTFY_03485 [Planctomycetota bacterium]|jgi:hypothetical protein
MENDDFTKGLELDNNSPGSQEQLAPVDTAPAEAVTAVAGEPEETVEDGRPCLADNIFAALDHLEHNFIFRKMGIAFDYVSRPGDFPRSALPKSSDIKSGIPNAAGIGTGLGECIDNTCLLLDGYLTRLELGISRLDEARIMDRLIAGLIRLGTISQQSRIVRGFSPDGRSYYKSYSALNCTWYAHGLLRAYETPTVAPESQAKLRDIGNKWLTALKRNNFDMPGIVNEKNSLLPLESQSEDKQWENSIRIIHLFAVMHHLTGHKEWLDLYKQYAFDQGGTFKVKADLPAALKDSYKLLSLQMALSDTAALCKEENAQANISLLLKKIAFRSAEVVKGYEHIELQESIDDAVLDWKDGLPHGDAPLSELKERVEKHWPRVGIEMESIAPAVQGALCIMLSGDENLIRDNAPYIEKLITGVEWDKLWTTASISPLLLAHALGHEYSLWDYSCEVSCTNRLVGESFGFDFDEENEKHKIDGEYIAKNYRKRSSLYPAIVEEQEGKRKSRGSAGSSSGKIRKRKTRRRRTKRRQNPDKNRTGNNSNSSSNSSNSNSNSSNSNSNSKNSNNRNNSKNNNN